MVTGKINYKDMSYIVNKNNLDYYAKVVNNKMNGQLKINVIEDDIYYELKGIIITTDDINKLCDVCPHNRNCKRGSIGNYDYQCYNKKYIPGLIVSMVLEHLENKANLCDVEDIQGLVENPEDYTMPIFWYNNDGLEIHNAQHTATCTYIKLDKDNHIVK